MEHLPPDSATKRALVAETPAEWDADEHLLAVIADRLGMLLWQGAGKKTLPKPDPIPRPGPRPDSAGRSQLTPDEMLDRLLDLEVRDRKRLGET